MPDGDPRKKFKYRVVFQGNGVINQSWEVAIFQDLGSSPACMEAGKAADCYGCFPDNSCQQADAEQAYIQADLQGATTWVSLPPEAWPPEWQNQGWVRPVVILKKALYGHPDSGTYWEKHCDAALRAGGFTPIESWQSCYWHETLRLFLVVYVDDFKLSGPSHNLAQGWRIIKHGLSIEDPTDAVSYTHLTLPTILLV